MKTINKLLLGLVALVAIGTLYLKPVSALTIVSKLYSFAIPASYGTGAADLFAKWSPASRSTCETAAAKVAFTGIALLDGVCSTTATDEDSYTDVFDASSVSGISAGVTGKEFLVATKARILAATNRDSGRDKSCEFFPVPIPATTGLTFINSTANIRSSLIFRKIQQ